MESSTDTPTLLITPFTTITSNVLMNQDSGPALAHTGSTYRPLRYERVYLPLWQVADTPFHIQGEDIANLACFNPLSSPVTHGVFMQEEIVYPIKKRTLSSFEWPLTLPYFVKSGYFLSTLRCKLQQQLTFRWVENHVHLEGKYVNLSLCHFHTASDIKIIHFIL